MSVGVESGIVIYGTPKCYFCGSGANGSDDHVPPEALFSGLNGSTYKLPKIITVPSCKLHNEDASQDDEYFAFIISDAGSLHSTAAMDVWQGLLQPVTERLYQHRKFANDRLSLMGIRFAIDPQDYDDEGALMRRSYDAAYVQRSETALRKNWGHVERCIRKIAAGLFFSVVGKSLGVNVANRLEIVCPDFKQIGSTITLTGLDMDKDAFFASVGKSLPWKPIESGSPDVFKCEFWRHRGSTRFAMNMCFFASVRVWVKFDESPNSSLESEFQFR